MWGSICWSFSVFFSFLNQKRKSACDLLDSLPREPNGETKGAHTNTHKQNLSMYWLLIAATPRAVL